MGGQKKEINAPMPIGICIKDSNWSVLFQNEHCSDVCGDRNGTICKGGCTAHCHSLKECGVGTIVQRIIEINGELIQVILTSDGINITTIQIPLPKSIRIFFQQLEETGLTKSELNIAMLKLSGYSNLEISQRCFVSYTTVKSHLNHIFSKIPEELAVALKSSLKK